MRHVYIGANFARLPEKTGGPLMSFNSAQLYKFAGEFSGFFSDCAHPSELKNNASFNAATDILADINVPLDTVKLYAQGVNPKLTCVALAALARRHDGSQALPEVLAHLGKFSQGWAI